MKKVLVTGGSGFVGRHAIPFLKEAGYEVHAPSHAEFDVLNKEQVSAFVAELKPTHLLHFAWIATPGVYQESPENHAWKDSSIHLFKECIANSAQRIVAAGSCFEYDHSDGFCVENKTALNAATLYGRCKNECREEMEKLDVSSAWGRIFFLYGPGEPPKKLLASVILSLLKGEKAECSHGRQIRDFMYVKDIASAFVALLESDVTGPVNIASGQKVTLKELVGTVGKILDKEDHIIFGAKQAPPNEPAEITAAVDRLQKEVGWKPKYTHEEALRETIEWWTLRRAQGDSVSW